VQLEGLKACCAAEGVVGWRLVELHEEVYAGVFGGVIQV
jgi:hypothetical protein